MIFKLIVDLLSEWGQGDNRKTIMRDILSYLYIYIYIYILRLKLVV